MFSKNCFCKRNIYQIVRLVLAAVSANGLNSQLLNDLSAALVQAWKGELFNQLTLSAAKGNLTILSRSFNEGRAWKIFDAEMIIRTLPTTFPQIFCKIILISKVIIKSIIYADYNIFTQYTLISCEQLGIHCWWTLSEIAAHHPGAAGSWPGFRKRVPKIQGCPTVALACDRAFKTCDKPTVLSTVQLGFFRKFGKIEATTYELYL